MGGRQQAEHGLLQTLSHRPVPLEASSCHKIQVSVLGRTFDDAITRSQRDQLPHSSPHRQEPSTAASLYGADHLIVPLSDQSTLCFDRSRMDQV